MKTAILGANGFVGGRLYELWQRRPDLVPRAVVRSPARLARIARFAGDWRLADARDASALTAAFAGCAAVVHCATGDERAIADTVEPVYRAAAAAGVRRLVYLSTAVVHGQNPAPGTTEATPLRDDQASWYNNAKVRAERRLARLAADGRVETVVLRPGIVAGPRSRWVLEAADALMAGRAAWIDGGRGVCHSIYVDNLAQAIECALVAPGVKGEAFLVGDAERVTWRDFLLGIAAGAGADERAFREARPSEAPRRTWRARVDAWRVSGAGQAVLARVPGRAKAAVKAALGAWRGAEPLDAAALPDDGDEIVASVEMTELFRCREKLSHAKAERMLGYRPPVSFAEGMRRSVLWLRECGYLEAQSGGEELR